MGEVLRPAAEALYSLALQQDAENLFVSHGAFDLIVDTLQDRATSENVRLELSKVLCESVKRFSGALPEEVVRKVERALKDMAQRPHVWSTRANANFREARSKLELQLQTSGLQPRLYS